jgi:cellulose synthase/poly-beta-1,6-N-acetylglucosamine synthase-like glycosyltransferase
MPEEIPMVTLQLPIFNEYYVTERLVRTVCQLDYPKEKMEIQILDDSTDNTYELSKELVEKYSAEGFDIKVLHRTDRTGYKAGALKEGLKSAKGEYIAIFDADFVPKKDFLKKTIPHFINEEIGMVQTRWEHINEQESYITKAQALALDGHFVLEQQVRNRSGFFMSFNGTAGVWRKTCIIDAGNWEIDTLTEDLDLSYRAQLNGWKFLFLNNVTSPAELPADINALKTQQFRWTKGAIEVAKKLLPKVFKAKLPLKVKMECYTQLTANIVFPMIVLVALLNIPIVIIKNEIGGFDQYYTFMSVFVLATASTFLFYAYAQRDLHQKDWRKRLRLFPVFLAGSMGLAINNSKAVFEALLGIKTGFVRTPKAGDKEVKKEANKKYAQKKIKPEVFVELLFTLYFIIGIGISAFYMEFAAIPFQLLFLYGFGSIGILSLKAAIQK